MKKVEISVANLNDKTEYATHITNLKQALDQGLVFKIVHKVINSKQNAWLKRYWYEYWPEKESKRRFDKYFFKLMNNAVLEKLWKMWENIEILNLLQQKEEETICCQNQIIILQSILTEKLLAIDNKQR